MPVYTFNEYADMHLVYGWADCVARRAAAEYVRRFPNRRHPDAQTFVRLDQRLRETGFPGVCNPDSGREREVGNAVHDAVLERFADDPRTSLRRTARALNTSYTTVQRIMKEDGQHDYKFRRVHELQEGDAERRLEMCTNIVEQYEADPTFLDLILWSDESTYGRLGLFNTKNEHYWAHENPHLCREDRFQMRFSLNMWVGMISDKIVGPWELPSPLNGENYLTFLQEDLPDLLDAVLTRHQQDNLIFMHDGAPAHFAADVRDHLDEVYEDRWIGRGGPIQWPARSPDLNPCDYGWWGWSKEVVYHGGAQETVEELRAAIHDHADNAEAQKLRNTTQDIIRRARLCIRERGGHFEHLLN